MEEELSNYHHNTAMEIEQLQNEMGFGTLDQNTSNNPHLVNPFENHQATNWDNNNEMQQQLPQVPTPDLLSLFHLPSSSVLPHSSITFTNPKSPGCFPGSFGFEALPETPSGTAASSVMYDPLFHLPPQPQPPLFRELLQSLPHGYNLGGSSLFSNGGDEGEDGSRQLFENGVLEFSKEMKPLGRGRGGNKGTKHFATERHRRIQLNGKFSALRDLVPNPTKVLISILMKKCIPLSHTGWF